MPVMPSMMDSLSLGLSNSMHNLSAATRLGVGTPDVFVSSTMSCSKDPLYRCIQL